MTEEDQKKLSLEWEADYAARRDALATAQPRFPSPGEMAAMTPGEIAKIRDAAAKAEELIRGSAENIEDERSGQLSPSHTPGRGRR
jgi:hypothetical protein